MTKPPPPSPTHTQTPPDRIERPWHQVLRDVGYPLECVVLDFETFFSAEYSLKNLTTPEYIADPRFEVLGLAHLLAHAAVPYADPAANAMFEVGEGAVASYLAYLQGVHGPDLRGCTVIMQNAPFDASVLAMKYGIWPRYVIDTLDLARAWHTRAKHDLGHLAKWFNLPDKGETKDFKDCTLRKRFAVPKSRKKGPICPVQMPRMTDAQIAALVGYATNDAVITFGVFAGLLPKLSNPALELRIQHHTLELFTRPCLRVDAEHGAKLIQGMAAEAKKVIADVGIEGLTHDDISGDKSFDRLLNERFRDIGEDITPFYKVCKTGWMLALAQDDAQRKLLLHHHDHVVRALCTARTSLDSWPTHQGRVARILRMAVACGGVLPVPLKYWGAHTGRASGGQKINLQNLPRQGHPLVVAMKALLLAAPGHKLAIVDLAAIEARVLAWIAGQWDLCGLFAAGQDVYCDMATSVAGFKVRKAHKDDFPEIARRYTAWRQRGKIIVLGAGYGMGAAHFVEYAAGQGVVVTEEWAKEAITAYRTKNAAIVGFWGAIERAFKYTATYRRPCSMERGLRFYSRPDCDVVIVLPNGRELKYHKVRVDDRELSVYNDVEHHWDYLWGGVLTENVVQAMSRDVMIEAAMRVEDAGYHVAHHVHDELIVHCKDEDAPAVLALTIKELSREPAWAPRLPLNAEGKIADRYGAH